MAPSDFPLPFEHVHWRSRRYAISEFRFVLFHGARVAREIALHDIAAVEIVPSILQRLTGVGTLRLTSARRGEPDLVIPRVWAAGREALRLELLIADLRGVPPRDGVARLPLAAFLGLPSPIRLQVALVAPVLVLLTLMGIAIGLSGHEVRVAYPADDRVRPRGVKRPDAEIVAFMEQEVMPWARDALAPVVGRGHVTCLTCHGRDAEARNWAMPAVRALPEPAVRQMAQAAGSDSQMRNALHGYVAQEDNLAIAAHMRGVVTPGMAALLRRPAYDFAQTYEYNRTRAAFGCYHCHMVRD